MKPTIVLLSFLILSCNAADHALVNDAENTLPGYWHIESMYIPENSFVQYFGDIIGGDTTLMDVGYLQIPDFSADSLELGGALKPVRMQMHIEGESISLHLDRLFLTADKSYFMYLRPGDSTTWTGPAGVFAESTKLFDRNHLLHLFGKDHVDLETANGKYGKITLKRE